MAPGSGTKVRVTRALARGFPEAPALWVWQRRARLSFTAGGAVTVAGASNHCCLWLRNLYFDNNKMVLKDFLISKRNND